MLQAKLFHALSLKLPSFNGTKDPWMHISSIDVFRFNPVDFCWLLWAHSSWKSSWIISAKDSLASKTSEMVVNQFHLTRPAPTWSTWCTDPSNDHLARVDLTWRIDLWVLWACHTGTKVCIWRQPTCYQVFAIYVSWYTPKQFCMHRRTQAFERSGWWEAQCKEHVPGM